jgi:hypothetical protein
MYWAMPVPIRENAGISNQNHQPAPMERERAIEINRKAMPMNILLNALSSVSRRPGRPGTAHELSSVRAV